MPRVTLVELPSLVHWRIQRGLTQGQLAEQIGMRRTTFWRIEAGYRTRMRTAHFLANALGVEIANLQRRPPEGLMGDGRIHLTVSPDELARVVEALRRVGDKGLVERFARILRHVER
jgi:transcriptional regulator with XRE-family HTH domain